MDNTEYLNARERDLKIRIYTDGTSTLAQIFDHGGDGSGAITPRLLAEGSAKRRKGDKRDSHLGTTLALSRAYQELAQVHLHLAGDRGAFQ